MNDDDISIITDEGMEGDHLSDFPVFPARMGTDYADSYHGLRVAYNSLKKRYNDLLQQNRRRQSLMEHDISMDSPRGQAGAGRDAGILMAECGRLKKESEELKREIERLKRNDPELVYEKLRIELVRAIEDARKLCDFPADPGAEPSSTTLRQLVLKSIESRNQVIELRKIIEDQRQMLQLISSKFKEYQQPKSSVSTQVEVASQNSFKAVSTISVPQQCSDQSVQRTEFNRVMTSPVANSVETDGGYEEEMPSLQRPVRQEPDGGPGARYDALNSRFADDRRELVMDQTLYAGRSRTRTGGDVNQGPYTRQRRTGESPDGGNLQYAERQRGLSPVGSNINHSPEGQPRIQHDGGDGIQTAGRRVVSPDGYARDSRHVAGVLNDYEAARGDGDLGGRVCPFCSRNFPLSMSMGDFQAHVLDCSPDDDIADTLVEEERICPFCQLKFDNQVPQETVDHHVNRHLDQLDAVSLGLENPAFDPNLN